MSERTVLELRDLPANHPSVEILVGYGTSTICRLSIDPTELPAETMACQVEVEWEPRAGGGLQKLTRWIGWEGVPPILTDARWRWPFTKNASDITEEAAVGVTAMLVHDLENGRVTTVLQIGSGGDYLLTMGDGQKLQVECSGIRVDPSGSSATKRLKEKCDQVLSKADHGIASVTAFSHGAGQGVYSYLHYTVRQ